MMPLSDRQKITGLIGISLQAGVVEQGTLEWMGSEPSGSGPRSMNKGEWGKNVTCVRITKGTILRPLESPEVYTLALGAGDDT